MDDPRLVLFQSRHPEARAFDENLESFVPHEDVIASASRVLVNRVGDVCILMPHVITDAPRRLFRSILGISHPWETGARRLQTSGVSARPSQRMIPEAEKIFGYFGKCV